MAGLAMVAILGVGVLGKGSADAAMGETPPALNGCHAPARLTPADAERSSLRLRYDVDFPAINYGGVARANPIARLQEAVNEGRVRLQPYAGRGYLDDVLKALDIDPASQILVYSRGSLQADRISSRTPRAIYFNDDVYVAWMVGTQFLEITAQDCEKGPVFYTLSNAPSPEPRFARENARCLTCHDSYGGTGGGTPKLLANSLEVDANGAPFRTSRPLEVTDRTPFEKRWGGWYVTGQHGAQTHLGNLLVGSAEAFRETDLSKTGNLASVAGLFNAAPYLTDTSDIVALMVFEHQAEAQTLISDLNFRARSALSRTEAGQQAAWADLPADVQARIKRPADALVDQMLFVGAAPFTDKVEGSAAYAARFQAKGPRDARGRSLRELDLKSRLFRYPMSYMIYSEAFDGLPPAAKTYIYQKLEAVLEGSVSDARYAALTRDDRAAILEILKSTKPEFARSSR